MQKSDRKTEKTTAPQNDDDCHRRHHEDESAYSYFDETEYIACYIDDEIENVNAIREKMCLSIQLLPQEHCKMNQFLFPKVRQRG